MFIGHISRYNLWIGGGASTRALNTTKRGFCLSLQLFAEQCLVLWSIGVQFSLFQWSCKRLFWFFSCWNTVPQLVPAGLENPRIALEHYSSHSPYTWHESALVTRDEPELWGCQYTFPAWIVAWLQTPDDALSQEVGTKLQIIDCQKHHFLVVCLH